MRDLLVEERYRIHAEFRDWVFDFGTPNLIHNSGFAIQTIDNTTG